MVVVTQIRMKPAQCHQRVFIEGAAEAVTSSCASPGGGNRESVAEAGGRMIVRLSQLAGTWDPQKGML
jgi:2-methylaconitate cis-trans-isomerase PrpF